MILYPQKYKVSNIKNKGNDPSTLGKTELKKSNLLGVWTSGSRSYLPETKPDGRDK